VAFTITWDDLSQSILTSVRLLCYQPPCNNRSHIAIIFKSGVTKILLHGCEQSIIFGNEFLISVGLLVTKSYTTQANCMVEFCIIKRQKDWSEETRIHISLVSTCAFHTAVTSTAMCTLLQILFGRSNQEKYDWREWDTSGGGYVRTGFWWRNLKEGDDLADLDTDGKLILKWITVSFIHQLMHQWVVLKTILKFTLKQLRNVSVLQLHRHQGAH